MHAGPVISWWWWGVCVCGALMRRRKYLGVGGRTLGIHYGWALKFQAFGVILELCILARLVDIKLCKLTGSKIRIVNKDGDVDRE